MARPRGQRDTRRRGGSGRAPRRVRARAVLLAATLALCGLAAPWAATVARAAGPTPDSLLQQVGFDQHLDAQVPLDLTLRDETGADVRLGDYFGARPVILTLNYYTCPNLCSLVLMGLAGGLRDVSFDPGKDFEVVTVSIDPGDTPATAATKKAAVLGHYGRQGADDGWHFLTGADAAIRQLAAVTGFRYAYDPRQQQYAHPSGVIVLTPAGHIARYLYGIQYEARDLRLGLVEASGNRIAAPSDRLQLLCYHYDATTGKYTNIVMRIVQITGLVVLAAIGTLLIWLICREPRRRAEV